MTGAAGQSRSSAARRPGLPLRVRERATHLSHRADRDGAVDLDELEAERSDIGVVHRVAVHDRGFSVVDRLSRAFPYPSYSDG